MIEIVPFSKSHLTSIAELEKICFSDPWSEELFSELVNNPLSVFITAVDDSKVTGYAVMYHVLDEGQIMNIAVSPLNRRNGTASKLLDYLMNYSKSHGIVFMTLEVRESNVPARSLYKKFGFFEVGKRKNYYSAPTEDAILMNLEL